MSEALLKSESVSKRIIWFQRALILQLFTGNDGNPSCYKGRIFEFHKVYGSQHNNSSCPVLTHAHRCAVCPGRETLSTCDILYVRKTVYSVIDVKS